jgi:hypothetical protein
MLWLMTGVGPPPWATRTFPTKRLMGREGFGDGRKDASRKAVFGREGWDEAERLAVLMQVRGGVRGRGF